MNGSSAISNKQLRNEALALQRECGIIQALETTRHYAFTPSYLQTVRKSEISAINITLAPTNFSKGITATSRSFLHIMESMQEWIDTCSRLPDPGVAIPILSVSDIVAAKRAGKVGIIFGCQGAGNWIDRDFVVLRAAYDLGLRIVGISYQARDIFAEGSGEEPSNTGLSRDGKKLVAELNRLGMVIDVSHMANRAALDVIEHSKHPVIFSHSNIRALHESVRNVSDEQIDVIAKSGGVVGISTMSSFYTKNVSANNWPTVDDYVDHIDYVVQRVGPDYVGIGLDCANERKQEDLDVHNRMHPEITGGGFWLETVHCKDLDGPQDMVNVTERLMSKGYKRVDLEKILSGNFLRVFKQVWGK